jgi:predicted secreted protein
VAEDLGRAIAFTWNGVAIPGVRSKAIKRNGAAVDVTSDENQGVRKLLENKSAQDNIDLSISGITKVRTLMQDWHAGTRTRAVVITFPDGSTLSGNFFLQDYTDTGPYNEAITFEAELLSDGAIVFTPGA